MTERHYIRTIRILAYTLAATVVGSVGFANTLPFGAHAEFANTNGTLGGFTPANRVESITTEQGTVTKQFDDLIYFSTKFPLKYDSAKIRITYKNETPNLPIYVGFKDQAEWHYMTQTIDSPLYHNPHWSAVGSDLLLYQWNRKFNSTEEFMQATPKNAIIGTLDYEFPLPEETKLNDYTPSNTETVINTPLRGDHTMYAYVQDEPFKLTIRKQDLNWYEDPDVLTIKVYKNGDLVSQGIIDDDGNATNNKQAGEVQEITIQNPGPELPEPGVYKIVLDASSDSVIKNIRTNLHKIVFEGSVYPVANSDAYKSITPETVPTTLYTNSNRMVIVTYHASATQDIKTNNTITPLTQSNKPQVLETQDNTTAITLPKSDVLLTGVGYFAFSEDQFFLPKALKILPIANESNLELADYVLTPSKPPTATTDGFLTTERIFDVRDAVPNKGQLSWVVRVPGLKDAGQHILIKSVEVIYLREGWWK